MTHKYTAIKVVQQPFAPPFFVAGISARELLQWCDVPRAKAEYMAGYQRSLDEKRKNSLTEYLAMSPQNIVPGAVIVAVDEDYIDTVPDGRHTFEIQIRNDNRDFNEKLEELFGAFTTRLSEDELESADVDFVKSDGYDSDDGDSEYPASYLAMLTKELQEAVTDWASIPPERQASIRNFIDGVSKPGLIIDGQHRVFGASGVVDKNIILPVVLLPGLKYSEQVFQFYVLNSKAKPLKPTELRRIVSTSLTNDEIQELYARFRQAGVDPTEAHWTLEMNTRPDSPFYNRIDFGYGAPGAIIKENVAAQLVRGFMKMPPRTYGQLTRPLGDRWASTESRLDIFFWFWNAVRDEYQTTWNNAEKLADDGSLHNLFMKVSLLTLQKFLLDRFVYGLQYRKNAPPPFSSEEEVRDMVSSTLASLPGAFFDKEWSATQIDTTKGRQELYETMEVISRNQGKMHGNLKIFTKQPGK